MESSIKPVKNSEYFCPICIVKKTKKTVTTRCGHQFCCDCFWIWADKNNSCPICRSTLLNSHHEIEGLYDRRSELINEIVDLVDEYDFNKLEVSRISNDLDDIKLEIDELKPILEEIQMYKKNPQKAMKMLDKRRKTEGIKIKNRQKILKKQMLDELILGEYYFKVSMFPIRYHYRDDDDDDFSEAFEIFNTKDEGIYTTSTKCQCNWCTRGWGHGLSLTECEVTSKIRKEYMEKLAFEFFESFSF